MSEDTLLDRLLAPEGKLQGGDPLDALVASELRRKSVVSIAMARDPAKAAEANRISRDTGVPPTVVEANLPRFRGEANAQAWSALIRDNPKLAAWLEQPRVAAIASDDRRAIAKVASAYDPKEWARRHGTITATPAPAPTFWSGLKGVIGSFSTWWDKFDASNRMQALDTNSILGIPLPSFSTPSADQARQRALGRRYVQAQAREQAATPAYTTWLGRTAYSASVSGAQMIPGLALSVAARNPAPALIAAGVQTGVPAYGKYRSRGGTAAEARVGAIGEGGAEVLTELLPMGFAVQAFGKTGVGKFLTGYLTRELPGELAATMAQDALDTAIANPDKTWGEYWQERPNALLQTAVSTLLISGALGGAAGATNRLARLQGEAIGAEANAEFLDELATRSAESEVRKRDPQAFASLLQTLGGDTVENVYIPGEAVLQYLQSDQDYDTEFWGPLAQQIGEAVETGGDILIPASDAMARLSGTKAWEALKDDVRLTPGGMSLREAMAFEEDYTAAIERSAADAVSAVESDREAQAPRQKVFDEYSRKLMDAGFTPDTARQYAELATARIATRAQRLGQELTGEEAGNLTIRQAELGQAVQGVTFEQGADNGPNARVTFDNGRAIIDLFKKHNLSSVPHEFGHVWLEEFWTDTLLPGIPDQLKADRVAVEAWFKANGHALGPDGSIPVGAHELWARGVERYLMEGKAPSTALRRAFDAFRSWLLSIYQVVQNLRSEITPEIRDVMDRLLATDEEIRAAAEGQNLRALFTSAAQAGMTEAEFAAYQTSAAEARNEAFDALLFRTMAAVRASRTKEYKTQEAGVRADVTEGVDSRPEFAALRLLREKGGMRLDRQWLLDTYGPDALGLVPQGVPPIYAENGSAPDAIAEASGFETGEQMVSTLMAVEARRKEMRADGDKRTVRQSVIDEETDAIMKDRYGDTLNDGTIEREARELIHNDKQGEVIASELRALSRKLPSRQPTPYQIAKRWAARKVAEGTVSEYTSRSAIQRFQRAARKAGAAAEQALVGQNIDEAFRQKQAQMLNNALVSEATKAADAVDSAVSRLGKVAKRRTIKSVDQDYLEQAQALLENVELRERSQLSIDKQGKFETWAREREAEGYDIIVPVSFEASLGKINYSRLSVEQLLGLDDTVKQIIHLGRLKQTLLDGQERRDFDALVKEAQDAAAKLPPKPPSDLMEPNWTGRFKSKVAGMDAGLLRMETVFNWLDKGDSEGVFTRVAFRPIAAAQTRENDMLADYYGRIKQAMGAIPKGVLKTWGDKIAVPEMLNRETGNPFVLTRQQLASVALNMGNEGNIQRLTDGYGWNEQGVREVLNRELTGAEWKFVQDVWDIIDTLWPEISALERKVNGVEPEKVEARPFDTPFGQMRGGYYPAIYDSSRSMDAEKRAGESGDLFETIYTKATTRASSTKSRSEKVSRPILLQIGVINRHLGEVIHDITHREAVMNADKFLSSRRVMKAVDDTLGPEIRKQFRPWLKFVANSWAMERAGNEGLAGFINKARTNATVVGMGYRFTTMMMQLAGYSNSFEYVGAKWVTEAIVRSAASPIASFNFVMERSGEVRHRMDTLDRDIRESLSKLAGQHNLLADAKRFAFHGIGYMDRVVSIPTWLGAYNKALSQGTDEELAIYEGDKAVRMSQGAAGVKDLAAVQRGTGTGGSLLKLFTMFYSYMSTVYQRQRTLGRDVAGALREGDVRATPRLVARAWWLLVVPPLLAEFLSGRGPDEDEEWGWYAIKKMLSQALGPIPVARDMFEPAWNKAAGNKAFDYQLSPLQRAGESVVKVAEDVGRAARGKEVKRPVYDTMLAAGYVTGLVPGQAASSAQFLVDVGAGKQDPDTVGEWWSGITTGKSEKKGE